VPIVENIPSLESAQCAFLDRSETEKPLVFSICESDFWNAHFFSFAFFQLENPFCVNAGSALDEFSIPLWNAFRQVWQRTASLLSSWCNHLNRSNHAVWNGLLLDSYSGRSLKIFGWYGLSDTFTKTWSGGRSCVFVVSSLPAIVVDGSKSFSFPGCSLVRIDFSTTPGSVSLVHGFTHDKSVPYLFSTPQARSQQQTGILIHLLKKLPPVNEIRIWQELQF